MTEQATMATPAPPSVASHGRLKRLTRALLRGIDRVRQRQALGELDARLLRDIGRTREEAQREAGKWL